MIPTWTYVKSKDALYVNMFVGSRIHVGQVAGTNVEVIQKTDYPWNGSISITVNPEEPKTFSVYVRIPDRTTSKLYKGVRHLGCDDPGVKRFAVNGHEETPTIREGLRRGHARVEAQATASNWNCPMEPQRVVADSRIEADLNLVALKYGPLVYNVEAADNDNIDRKLGDAPLRAEWRPDLLGGVMVISGNGKMAPHARNPEFRPHESGRSSTRLSQRPDPEPLASSQTARRVEGVDLEPKHGLVE